MTQLPIYGELPVSDGPAVGLRGRYRAIKQSLPGRLMARQKNRVWRLLGVFLFYAAVEGLIAKVTVDLVNKAIVDQTVPLRSYVAPAVGLSLMVLLVAVTSQLIAGKVAYIVEFDLRTWVYSRVQHAPLDTLDGLASGQLLSRVQQDLQAVDRLVKIVPALIIFVPFLLGMCIALLILAPVIAALAIAALPINLYLLQKMRDRLRGLSWMELNESAQVTSSIVEPVLGVRVMHAFHRVDDHRERVGMNALRAYRVAMTKNRLVARFDLLLKSIPIVILAMSLWVGAHMVASGSLAIGTFGLAIGLAGGLTKFAATFDLLAVQWQLLRGSQDRFAELLRLPQLPETAAEVALPAPAAGLDIDSLVVERGGRAVLDRLSLTLAPGELVVVTGTPGSGKSLLAGVLAGQVLPNGGSVTLEGHAWAELNRTTATEAVRVVGEAPILFAGSIRDNVLLGARGDVDDAELLAALAASGADEVLAAVGGLDAAVGDRGLTLSGGQRQRLALARALVTRPRILVLDDALSAVQPALEVQLLQALRAFDPGMSILFITRRAGAGAVADRILQLPEPPSAADRPAQLDDAHVAEQLIAGARAAAGDADLSLDPKMRALVGDQVLGEDPVPAPGYDNNAAPSVRALFAALRARWALALFFLVGVTVAQAVPALLLGKITDDAKDGQLGHVNGAVLLTMLLGVMCGLAARGYTVNAALLTHGTTYLLRRQVFQRVSTLGIDYYDRELPGQVATRVVNDLVTINYFLSTGVFVMLVETVSFISALLIIGVIAPQVLLTVALMAVTLVVMTAVGTRYVNRAAAAARTAFGGVLVRFEEDFSGVLEIRNLGALPARANGFLAASQDLIAKRRRAVRVTAVYTQSLNVVGSLTALLILIQAGSLVLSGALSVGLVLTLQQLVRMATQPVKSFTQYFDEAIASAVSWRRIQEFWAAPVLPVERANAQPCPALHGDLELANVSFSYPHTGLPVLVDLSARVPSGAIVALVGYTGAGKSSIAKVLQRVYDPEGGAVRVNGVDVRDLDLTSYRQRVGVVPQDAFLFRGTVASNIAYGRPTATRAQIEAAAQAIGAAEVIQRMPGGYDAYVAESGSNLTGAERQLVALARAWLIEPHVLVLDEATSALDAATERSVLEAVQNLECTTLAVTHRESVVAIADHILVLDGGQVVEQGTPAELVGAGGAYDKLWHAEPSLQVEVVA